MPDKKDELIKVNEDIPVEAVQPDIRTLIYIVRGQQVMLDSDLAMLYNTETAAINRAVKRNKERFPEDFCFQLNKDEYEALKCQIGISKSVTLDSNGRGGRRTLPYVFTEEGISMLSSVLRSKTAVQVNIRIMRVFVEMRRYTSSNAILLSKISNIETKQIESEINLRTFEQETDEKFEQVFEYISDHEESSQKIFFDGQIYDAFSLLVDLIRQAEKSITLIDGYVSIDTLNILTKKNPGVSVVIYTSPGTPLTKTDISKFNVQYPELSLKHTTHFHDRFIILDESIGYNIGASLKDAGKKAFAINKIESSDAIRCILEKVEGEINNV